MSQTVDHLAELTGFRARGRLTGLFNRKTFDDSFFRTAALSAPSGSPQDERRDSQNECLPNPGVVDIDHLKVVNDQHDHLISGEEFVVPLRCAGDEPAAAAFERRRAVTEGYAFPQVGTITVSVGFTQVRPADNPGNAFDRADKALYWAKAHGRNQIANYGALVESGEIKEDERRSDVELF